MFRTELRWLSNHKQLIMHWPLGLNISSMHISYLTEDHNHLILCVVHIRETEPA